MRGRRGLRSNEELQELYRQQVRPVYAFFAYSVDAATAEDLTAITFERAIRAWNRFDRRRGSERTWVLSIARNLLTDHFRSQKHRPSLSCDEHPRLLAELVSEDDPLQPVLVWEELARLLSPLSPRDRAVLALRYGADLESAEIARVMDLTSSNVHQIISRSLRRLRRLVEVPELAAVEAVGSARLTVSK